MTWFIGVDVGGTFTDFYAFDERTGRGLTHKRPSTPDNPADAILAGLDDLRRDHGVEPAAISRLGHGTTVATNALIQRRGARVALITTEGFRDLLEIGRQTRPKMYDLKADYPPPLVPRARRFEIEGSLWMTFKWLAIELHRLVIGEIRGNYFRYFNQRVS